MTNQVTLAELNLNLGTRDELAQLADDVGLELEDGMEDLALAEAICATIDAMDDAAWNGMSDAAKAWSNRVNATKKAYKERQAKAETKREAAPADAEPAADDWKALTVPKLKAKAKELGVTGYGSMKKGDLIAAIDAALAAPPAQEEAQPAEEEAEAEPVRVAGDEPTDEELEKLKAQAKAKAASAPAAKKQVISDKPFKPDTTAWMVTLCVKEAGKKGITMDEIHKEFEQKVKKAKAICTNTKGRCSTIIRQALNIKGLVTKKGDKYFPTAKLNKAD